MTSLQFIVFLSNQVSEITIEPRDAEPVTMEESVDFDELGEDWSEVQSEEAAEEQENVTEGEVSDDEDQEDAIAERDVIRELEESMATFQDVVDAESQTINEGCEDMNEAMNDMDVDDSHD